MKATAALPTTTVKLTDGAIDRIETWYLAAHAAGITTDDDRFVIALIRSIQEHDASR